MLTCIIPHQIIRLHAYISYHRSATISLRVCQTMQVEKQLFQNLVTEAPDQALHHSIGVALSCQFSVAISIIAHPLSLIDSTPKSRGPAAPQPSAKQPLNAVSPLMTKPFSRTQSLRSPPAFSPPQIDASCTTARIGNGSLDPLDPWVHPTLTIYATFNELIYISLAPNAPPASAEARDFLVG
jgi:hypothetical protein